jgi:hypothetical protein
MQSIRTATCIVVGNQPTTCYVGHVYPCCITLVLHGALFQMFYTCNIHPERLLLSSLLCLGTAYWSVVCSFKLHKTNRPPSALYYPHYTTFQCCFPRAPSITALEPHSTCYLPALGFPLPVTAHRFTAHPQTHETPPMHNIPFNPALSMAPPP